MYVYDAQNEVGGRGMNCHMCDNPLEGRGFRLCAFDIDYGREKIIEYYCTAQCLRRAFE